MKPWLIAALAAGQLLLCPPVAAQPVVQTVEQHRDELGEVDRRGGDFVHRASGFVFPSALADMPARKTITYGPHNAAVYYTQMGGGNSDPWLDLFVYPAQTSLAEEVANVSGSITARSVTRAIPSPAGIPDAPTAMREGWYDADIRGVPSLTGYRMVRDGDWFIKVRLTIPKAGGQLALDRAWRGLAKVPWTVGATPAMTAPSAPNAPAPTISR